MLVAGGCDPPDVPRETAASKAAPITHGQPDTTHPAVVGVGLFDPCVGDPPTVVCTGTVVAPRVVVTAAHCLDFPHELGRVFYGENLDQSGDGALIADATAHPGFDAVTYLDDIGVVFLREDAPVAPVPLRQSPLGPADIGAQVQIVGYGLTHLPGERPGLRRSGTSVITAVEATRFRTEPDPSMSCQLDSGGPVLMLVDGQQVLAGVTSSGDAFCKEYGLNTRVDAFYQGFLAPALTRVGSLSPPAPTVCPEVSDCTIHGCPEGQTCDTIGGACFTPIAAKTFLDIEGGCAAAPHRDGKAALASLLLALCGALGRRRGSGQTRRSSRYSETHARHAARQRQA